mmetsp:Transcript_46608/g.122380  ORF Transcript_46608/g.122380 Transcript_46608/m.122380 type:complete len:205 (+) Transcript_46608:2-616(+)
MALTTQLVALHWLRRSSSPPFTALATAQSPKLAVAAAGVVPSKEPSSPPPDDSPPIPSPALPAPSPSPSYASTNVPIARGSVGDSLPHAQHGQGSRKCLERTLGYWTYEICLQSNVTQFHSIIKGADRRSQARLGQYSKTAEDGAQIYVNGDLCKSSADSPEPQSARASTVRAGCGKHDRVVNIREPEKCRYEFEVELQALCEQ